MKKKERAKFQTYVGETSSKNNTQKSAWDIAKEWKNLGKDKIRKMELEVCPSS